MPDHADRSDSHADLEERLREITALTVLLREQEVLCEAIEERAEWLRRVAVELAGKEAARSRRPFLRSGRRDLSRDFRNLFDGNAYLRRYPDVAGTGMDPLLHYLSYGIKENRLRNL